MSPVVGMIMILAISIVGISAIITWGLPAIQELKSNAETRAVQDQFRDLDDALKSLVAGSAGKTAFKWQPTMNEGAIAVETSSGGRWVVASDLRNNYNLSYFGLNDTDQYFAIHNDGYGFSSNLKVRAWSFVGTTFTELNVTDTSGTVANALTLANGNNITLKVLNSTGAGITLNNLQLRVYVYNATLVTSADDGAVARLWVVDVGSIHFVNDNGVSRRHIYSNNGAVIAGTADALVIKNDPPIPATITYTNSTGGKSKSIFIRLIQYNGSASFAGERNAELLLNLYTTTSLADESNVSSVRIYVLKDSGLRDTWYSFLSDTLKNYTLSRIGTTASSPVNGVTMSHEHLYEMYAGEYRFRLVYSVVTALKA